ncbi:DUF4365 domain-containing protein [Nostoc sp.]|uniref:DUF4365 domain-containing protein n=1 Tax=Nostoc sp. TaxID=1180 RepID=UPI002FFAE3D6
MNTAAPWYIEKRAESLAIVYLTRRDDLIISHPTPEKGLDFLITITKDGISSDRLFGVEVKATVSTSELIQHNEIYKLKSNRDKNTNFFRDLPFPVCLFFFTLDNDQAYYKWILEPNNDQKNVGLNFNENDELKKLHNKEIANIISIVNSWYDYKNNALR